MQRSVFLSAFLMSLVVSFNAFAGASEWVPFRMESGHVEIPVKIEGIETYAMLDTGAQINAMNKAFLIKNNLSPTKGAKTRVKGVFGVEDKTTYNNVNIEIFGIKTEIDDLVETRLGHHSRGILMGAGFFEQFIVQIDYPNQRMRILTHDAMDLKKYENIKFRAQRGTGRPMVRVGLGKDRDAWLLLDTGSNGGVMVTRPLAERMNWLGNETTRETVQGVNTARSVESVRIDNFTFGPYELENVLATVPAEGESANLIEQYSTTGTRIRSAKIEGILGYDILKHFVLSIDYKNGHAHIGLPQESD